MSVQGVIFLGNSCRLSCLRNRMVEFDEIVRIDSLLFLKARDCIAYCEDFHEKSQESTYVIRIILIFICDIDQRKHD